jgi:hypothetical protein
LLEAGLRPLLTVSLPIPKTAILDAVDVAAPLDDPEEKAAVRYFELYGDSARPYRPLCIPPAAMGGMFVLPIRTAPASLNFAAIAESSLDINPSRAGEPFVTLRPRYL